VKINAAEGNMRSFIEALEGEEMLPEFNTLRLTLGLPDLPRWIIRQFVDKRRSFLLGCSSTFESNPPFCICAYNLVCMPLAYIILPLFPFLGRSAISVYELWQLLADLLEMREKWEAAVQQAGIDAIIFPALPLVAMPHGIPGRLTAALLYMFIANLLLWPSGVVPVTTVQTDEQHYILDSIPEDQQDAFAKLAQKVMHDSAGLPLGVLIMTPLFQDETCLRVMKQVERVANFTEQPTAYFENDDGS
jgi:fatty acid amide hydrolase